MLQLFSVSDLRPQRLARIQKSGYINRSIRINATLHKMRTVVDLYSRYSPVLDPRFSYHAEDVVQTLERTGATVG